MKFKATLCCLSMLLFSAAAQAAGPVAKVMPSIKSMAANPAVIEAVKAQNAQGLSLTQIKVLDNKWKDTQGGVPEAEQAMSNDAATALKSAESQNSAFLESILTDNQGANVAITAITSDYWQGDEPKFTRSFKDGAGADYAARPKKDASTGQVVSQISVPVMDGGKAIGTLTVSVDLKQVQ